MHIKSAVQQWMFLSHNTQVLEIFVIICSMAEGYDCILAEGHVPSLCMKSKWENGKYSYLTYFSQSHHWRSSSSKCNFCHSLLALMLLNAIYKMPLIGKSVNVDYRRCSAPKRTQHTIKMSIHSLHWNAVHTIRI